MFLQTIELDEYSEMLVKTSYWIRLLTKRTKSAKRFIELNWNIIWIL